MIITTTILINLYRIDTRCEYAAFDSKKNISKNLFYILNLYKQPFTKPKFDLNHPVISAWALSINFLLFLIVCYPEGNTGYE